MGPIRQGPMPLNISSSPSNDQLVENQGEAEEVNFKTLLLRTRGVGDLLNLFGFFFEIFWNIFLKYRLRSRCLRMERLTTNVPGLTICFSKCLDIFLSFKVSLLHRLVPDTLPHMAFPLHRPHGHLHVLRWTLFCVSVSVLLSIGPFFSSLQVWSETLRVPTLCLRTTWLLGNLPNIGGLTQPGENILQWDYLSTYM